MVTTWEGDLNVVKYVVEQAADKEATDDGGWTALLRATSHDHVPAHLDVVKYLN